MGKINLTISSSDKTVLVEYLLGDTATVTGSELIRFTRLRDELDGWWFDKLEEAEHNRKVMFADIVNLNGSTIGATTQAAVTALLSAAISVPGVPYKSYVATLTQTGTDDPVATVIENTLGFDLLWARGGDVGNYVTISHYDLGSAVPLPAGSFPENKTTCSISQTTAAISEPLFAGIKKDNDVQIEIQTGNIGDKYDNVLQGHVVEIRIYP